MFRYLCNHKDRQVTNQSSETCIFPDIIELYEWYSINQTIRMDMKNTDIELIGINRRFRCREIISSENSISIYRIQSFENWYL